VKGVYDKSLYLFDMRVVSITFTIGQPMYEVQSLECKVQK